MIYIYLINKNTIQSVQSIKVALPFKVFKVPKVFNLQNERLNNFERHSIYKSMIYKMLLKD
jgi:hypothetical protein